MSTAPARARRPGSASLARAASSPVRPPGSRRTAAAMPWRMARSFRNAAGEPIQRRARSSQTRAPSSARLAFASIRRSRLRRPIPYPQQPER